MTDGARYVVAELVREPVKDAVREALDEEAAAVRTDERDADRSTDRSEPADQDDDSGGGSRIGLVIMSVGAALGAAYLVRKRRSETEQSTWSEFEGEGGERDRTEDGRTEHAPGSTGADAARADESTASPAADE